MIWNKDRNKCDGFSICAFFQGIAENVPARSRDRFQIKVIFKGILRKVLKLTDIAGLKPDEQDGALRV